MGNECGEESDNGAGGKEWLTMLGRGVAGMEGMRKSLEESLLAPNQG
jgi:hypothetical protein